MLTSVQEAAVEKLILSVGEYIRHERTGFDTSSAELKKLHDLVSYVDKTAEEKLIQGLLEILPDASILAEESGVLEAPSKLRWIIDPLDGTTNFIHHIPHFCISVALENDGQMLAGWVYEINKKEIYFASKGKGAMCNHLPISVSKTNQLDASLIALGFPVNKFERLDPYLKLLKEVIVRTRGARRLGTAAYDLCLVASGRVEAYFEYGLSPWDVAAGALIVEEAGGRVTDFKGGNEFVFGEEIVASNAYIHQEFLNMVKANMK